jgi:hypothetical protein
MSTEQCEFARVSQSFWEQGRQLRTLLNELWAWLLIWVDKGQPHWLGLPMLKVIWLNGQKLA